MTKQLAATNVHSGLTGRRRGNEPERLLRRTLEHLPIGSVSVIDRAGRFLLLYGQLDGVDDRSSGELLGQTADEVFPSEFRAIVDPYYRRAFAGEKVEFEFSYGPNTLSAHISPLDLRDGEVETVVSVWLDTTERAEAERERQRLLEQERQARAETELLLEATAQVGAQLEPESVLRTLVEYAAELIGAERASYVVEQEGDLLLPRVWRGGVWDEGKIQIPTESVSGHVWSTAKPYLTNDVTRDRHGNRELSALFDARSVLGAPMLDSTGRAIGVVVLINARRTRGFREHDQALLAGLCRHASAILERAREAVARRSAEEARARMEGALLAGRAIEHRMNQELAVILGRAEVLQAMGQVGNPALVTHISAILDAARRIVDTNTQLQRTWRVVTQEAQGVGSMLDIDASAASPGKC